MTGRLTDMKKEYALLVLGPVVSKIPTISESLVVSNFYLWNLEMCLLPHEGQQNYIVVKSFERGKISDP